MDINKDGLPDLTRINPFREKEVYLGQKDGSLKLSTGQLYTQGISPYWRVK